MTLIVQAFSAHTTIYASQPVLKQPYQNRDIYIVYDNSGSMLNSNEVCESPWYEAAYVVELVASAMEEGDRLHIYFMKDSSQDQYFNKEEYTQGKESLGERIRENLSSISYTNMFDELSEKTIEEDSELYDYLKVTIETINEGGSEEFDTREKTVSWSEGVVQLTARVSLDGLMEEVIERQIIVEDPLEIERVNPEQEIDIDEMESIRFKVMNKEENISSQVDVYVEEPSDGQKTFYEYTLEYDKKGDLWRISPEKKDDIPLGEERVSIRVADKQDREMIAEKKEIVITYYATDKTLD